MFLFPFKPAHALSKLCQGKARGRAVLYRLLDCQDASYFWYQPHYLKDMVRESLEQFSRITE